MSPKSLFSAKLLCIFFNKKALIYPIVEQIDSTGLSKIKSQIMINLASPLKTGLFLGHNTDCV